MSSCSVPSYVELEFSALQSEFPGGVFNRANVGNTRR